MPQMLTRRGARELTQTLDRVASVLQAQSAVLGIDPKIATDFAYRSDLLSDAIEGTAVRNYPRLAEVLEQDGDEAFLKGFGDDQVDQSELSDRAEGDMFSVDKFAALLTEAEASLKTSASKLPEVMVQGYDGFTDQIRQLEVLSTQAQELDAQIQAAVGPLLEKSKGLEKEIAVVHDTIKKEYKENLTAIGNVTIERKTALVEARAMLKVSAVKRSLNDVQVELLASVTEKYGKEIAEYIATTQAALQDVNKNMRVAFQGFELEARALDKTASSKQAGLADLLSRFQDFLSKSWKKLVSVVQHAATLVAGASKQADRTHVEFMKTCKELSSVTASSKRAGEEAPEKKEEPAKDEESDKTASFGFNLFAV